MSVKAKTLIKKMGLAMSGSILTVVAGLSMAQAADSVKHPVVVELFTSQGCNSCPPAEKYLNKLADREDVIALEFHVDYWDYIGWKDPFADASYTQRQRSYAGPLSMRYIYTPQMVINGLMHEVGSREMSVEVAIDQQTNLDRSSYPVVSLEHGTDDVTVTIKGNGYEGFGKFDIILVSFDDEHATKVTRGENRGKTLINKNIVRDMKVIQSWKGGDYTARIPVDALTGNGGCAVLLQKRGGGEILAAAQLHLNHDKNS